MRVGGYLERGHSERYRNRDQRKQRGKYISNGITVDIEHCAADIHTLRDM